MSAAVTHKRILLIDDNPGTREAISMLLASSGYCVALAGNGADALQRLREHRKPDLILLDLAMPVLGGHEFRRLQQQDADLAAIPVLVVSGTERAEEEAAGLGAAGCLRKPVETGRLLDAIRRCLEARHAEGQDPPVTSSPAAPCRPPAP
jgi:two-component system response regulator MprA